MITFKPAPTQFVQQVFINSHLLGTFEMLDDGYWHYAMPRVGVNGLIASHILRELADKLDELNEPWDRIVHQQLSRKEEGILEFKDEASPN